MESQNVVTLLKEIKETTTSGMLDTMHNFVSYYYQKFYQGTEVPEVFDFFYVDSLKFELCFLLGAMASYTKQKNLGKSVEQLILQVKIDSYKNRRTILMDWMNNNYKSKFELTQFFLNRYEDKDKYQSVKEDLGLQLSKKELMKELKGLK